MYSNEEFPIENVNQSKIGRTFKVVENDSSKSEMNQSLVVKG